MSPTIVGQHDWQIVAALPLSTHLVPSTDTIGTRARKEAWTIRTHRSADIRSSKLDRHLRIKEEETVPKCCEVRSNKRCRCWKLPGRRLESIIPDRAALFSLVGSYKSVRKLTLNDISQAQPGRRDRAMTSNLNIYRSAKPLIDQHGEDASSFAAMQADKRGQPGAGG